MTPLTDTPPGAPVHLVVMGVSGCGKSTVAQALRQRLGWELAEGDDFHPQANIDKMASGRPLMDEDRWPWLRILAGWTSERDERGESTILSCSALRRSYRDLLREGGAGTFFVHLHGDKGILLERMEEREHFMPPSLLESQLDTLEMLEPDEPGVLVDIANPPERAARLVLAQLDLDSIV
ncbi:gluconokinase [Ornithinimicrobium humiphilum]|uniref:Gluconokinase n=1 Tax=Ornithinimicrobium humiphilum TaxID=125288 RepID=A0A543K7S1_9MICO|nr:gluconokinase [Ornithinimicrobium humiphilum]TQM91138.1 gluconokinase [Ornithinimicrobium humiphilum]